MVGEWNGRGMIWHVMVRVWYGMTWHGRGLVWHGKVGVWYGMALVGKWNSMA